MASLTSLSDLPSFDINQYSSNNDSSTLESNKVSDDNGNVNDDEFLVSEEFNTSLSAILNGTADDTSNDEGKETSQMAACSDLKDDTMEDALAQMETSLNMKNVDEEDQAQAAMLADALITKVMRTHESGNGNGVDISAMLKDQSLWRAHSVLAEVSQIGVWSHNQQYPGTAGSREASEVDTKQSPITNMKLDNHMRQDREHSEPIGGWQIP